MTPHISTLMCAYDGVGRRIETLDESGVSDPLGNADPSILTRHVYSWLRVVEEYVRDDAATPPDPNWVLAREFVWGDTRRFPEPLALIDYSAAGEDPNLGVAETVYYLRDVLGSVIGLADPNGDVVERYVYDPYGRTAIEQWDGSNWSFADVSLFDNPYMWTGQRYDAGVELYAFYARTYSPRLGRWLQRDPAGYVDGPNLFAYVSGRALSAVDPLGLYRMIPIRIEIGDIVIDTEVPENWLYPVPPGRGWCHHPDGSWPCPPPADPDDDDSDDGDSDDGDSEGDDDDASSDCPPSDAGDDRADDPDDQSGDPNAPESPATPSGPGQPSMPMDPSGIPKSTPYLVPGSEFLGAVELTPDLMKAWIAKKYRDLLIEKFEGDEEACAQDPECASYQKIVEGF